MSTSAVTDTATNPYAALAGSSAASGAGTAATGSSDTFLKLLVTQMQNQDPLNPMDNAQITSQMAQISTVNGINTLNTTVQGLNSQFVQMQALQGASLVGHDVTIAGNGLDIAGGTGVAGYHLAGAADEVKVEVMDPSGRVVDTLQLGAQGSGDHDFSWQAPAGVADGSDYTFKVAATSGASAVASSPLMLDRVLSVSASGSTLTLDLARSGSVPYTAIQAFN